MGLDDSLAPPVVTTVPDCVGLSVFSDGAFVGAGVEGVGLEMDGMAVLSVGGAVMGRGVIPALGTAATSLKLVKGLLLGTPLGEP